MAAFAQCARNPSVRAVAKCPQCNESFSRPYLTEHHHQMICVTCLEELVAAELAEVKPSKDWLGIVSVALGLSAGVLFFYILGRILIWIPASFHEMIAGG